MLFFRCVRQVEEPYSVDVSLYAVVIKNNSAFCPFRENY